MKGIHHF